MGYPMTYSRVIERNELDGDYYTGLDPALNESIETVAGDLRRLEKDQRDDYHLAGYASRANITKEQAKIVLDEFFGGTF